MSIKLKGSTAGSVALDAPANTSPSGSDIALTLPIDAGSANQYLKNGSTAGALEFADGGKILQVVQATKTDGFATSSTSYTDITGLSSSITPASSSNKVLVRVCVMIGTGSTSNDNRIRVLRGSTNILTTDYIVRSDESTSACKEYTIEVLDSPSTTSSTTYKVQGKVESNEIFVNRRGDSSVMGQSTVTLMEVSA